MIQTEAFVLTKKGTARAAFQLATISLPALTEDQVIIDVEAFGLNYADVMARRGLYREAPPMPCVVGYEVVGTISAIGAAVDPSLIGKRVVAFCRFGGYAKKAISQIGAFQEINELDAGAALALATQFVTAYYMVYRAANVQSGESVLIHAAAGGVGTALIQLCKIKGATVIAKVGGADKLKLVNELGADCAINYQTTDYQKATTDFLGNDRLDVSFNPVAGSTFKKDWAMLGSGGRLVLFGGSELGKGKFGFLSTLNFVRKMGFIVPIGLMMRSKNILGVNMLKLADNKPHVLTDCLKNVVELLQQQQIQPIVGGEYTADTFFEAQDALESGKSTGKLIVKWN
jgi:NADPH2:quinone reductase